MGFPRPNLSKSIASPGRQWQNGKTGESMNGVEPILVCCRKHAEKGLLFFLMCVGNFYYYHYSYGSFNPDRRCYISEAHRLFARTIQICDKAPPLVGEARQRFSPRLKGKQALQ